MTYGGGLWRTWLDRDLTLAGKVIVNEGNKLVSKYWHAKRPLVMLPSLCIHLDQEREAFKINKENHLKPFIATQLVDQLFQGGVNAISEDTFNVEKNHYATLTNMMADDIGVSRDSIVNFELNFCDVNPSNLTGIHEEFITSPRLDNLFSSFASLDALIEHSKIPAEQRDHSEIDMIMLFDHEEVGSQSAQGADSNMAVETTERIFEATQKGYTKEDYFRAIHRSLVISADMSHAVHPNYSHYH